MRVLKPSLVRQLLVQALRGQYRELDARYIEAIILGCGAQIQVPKNGSDLHGSRGRD